MRRTFVALLALVGVDPTANADVAAGTPMLTWVAPTEDVNGNPLSTVSGAPTAIRNYRIYCDPAEIGTYATGIVQHPSVTWQAAVGKFGIGTHSCIVQTRLNNDKRSGPSNVVNFIIPDPQATPKPPTTFGTQ